MNHLIILSGGTGSRMRTKIPKQYIEINNKPIIFYTLKSIDFSVFTSVVIVVAEDWKSYLTNMISNDFSEKDKFIFAPAGTSRQESILNGLNSIRNYLDEDVVVIHDAARPLVTNQIITKLIDLCKDFDGAMPVLPVKDTIYISKDNKTITGLLNRDELYAGQSPEAFKIKKYHQINKRLSPTELRNIKGSSEIAYKNNMSIGLTEGSESNFKITTPIDLERFISILDEGKK